MAPIARSNARFVRILRERLRRDVDRASRFTVILEKSRNGHQNHGRPGLTERRPFLCEDADNRVRVPAHANDFADRRFVREQSFLDDFSNDNYAPEKLDGLHHSNCGRTERVSIRSEESFIGSHNEKAWRCLDPVEDRPGLSLS